MIRAVSVLAAGLTAAIGAHALSVADLGALSHHMGVHLLLMNALAPLLALACRRMVPAIGGSIFAATAAQMVALWAIHLPAIMNALAHGSARPVAMHGLLFALAFWFWLAVAEQQGAERWRGILALMVTGKLACLLAVLLVFAPRPLYPDLAGLADQQQAGLWMIAACTLSYVAAAIVMAVLWLADLGLGAVRSSRRSIRPA